MVQYAAYFRTVDRWAREMEPIYRTMYERCASYPVGLNRWAL
jgi:hypothetical protein